MCGRFVITSPPAALRQIFGYAEQPNFPPRYNIAPTQPIPVVIVENGVRHFRLMRWGLLPAWVKDPRKFTSADQCAGRNRAGKAGLQERDQAAALPDSGRWLLRMAGLRRRKRPHFIYRRDGQPMGLAGLAETWIGPNGEELDTVAIVTAPASADLAVLHHRVPVTIAPGDFDRWLDCRDDDAETAMALLAAPGRRRVRLARDFDAGQSRRQ